MDPSTLISLLVLVGLSVVCPLAAVRVRLPSAVALILAGIACGPAGLHLIADTPLISFVSDLGFLILMFIAGMEIDFDALRLAGPRALVAPALAAAGVFVMALILRGPLQLDGIETLVVSATSVGMPLAVLQETGKLRTPVGQRVMIIASIGEFFSIVAVIGYDLITRHGVGAPLALELSEVIGLLFASALVIRWARAAVWWYPVPFGRLVHHHDVAEIGVRVGLLVMLTFVSFAVWIGVEGILGAFIAGALVGFVLRERRALEAKIAALGHGLFIPVFFVMVGVRFQPALLDAPAVRDALVLTAVAGVVKLVPTLIFAGKPLRFTDRVAASSLLAAPLTLVVAIGAIGQRLGIVTPRRGASIVLVAIALSVIFPSVYKRFAGARAAGAPAGT